MKNIYFLLVWLKKNSACVITVEVRTPDNCDFCLVGMICHSLEISLLRLSKYIPSKPTFVELIFGKSPTYQGLCLSVAFAKLRPMFYPPYSKTHLSRFNCNSTLNILFLIRLHLCMKLLLYEITSFNSTTG